jgi:hypothetical protein
MIRKDYGRFPFFTEIETSTAFKLLTRLQIVPIVAALQSVGEFSRAFSITRDGTLFCEIDS